ncbi:MAG: indolepyruvate ferredoxin oxidoreductase subunit alpha [Propionibacteriaceae bacterium]|jgi:indolepyruvate ferredoxin oxidoreductase alpha subunit|nr:indolepyruvate ferredoxin oxidoreductase subunit alpha [Propionibacteriaceae bacterium]
MQPQLMSGNEAIAHGAVRAGAGFACGYPGTPSTEIVETAAKLSGIHAQWCVNEKVAVETGVGAALAGVRTLVTMKHVGLNVAMDPFMAVSLAGVNAGLVILSADDPGMHSSQNEQDNRNLARFAKIPLLEPSDSQEAYDFIAAAFELSEEFDTPVLLRTTTRVSHGRGLVVPGEPVELQPRPYTRDISKYVMVPANASKRNHRALQRLEELRARAEVSPLNVIEPGTIDFGIITSGVAYEYAKEAFPDAWFLKLGFSNPLPYQKVLEFYGKVSRVAVVEELDPFLEEQIRALGLPVYGKEYIPAEGELDQDAVRRALEPCLTAEPPARGPVTIPGPQQLAPAPAPALDVKDLPILPVRPPVLCPGCPHRAVFSTLRKRRMVTMGDIGCYTLGALAPLLALDTSLCMGASIGMMAGFNKALGKKAAVGVIGDSTFFHSGITALLDARYNEAEGVVVILDNRTTAMTGQQGHPGTGVHPDNTDGPAIDIVRLCLGLGVRVQTTDPADYKSLEKLVREEVKAPGLSVIVVQSPCILYLPPEKRTVEVVDDNCNLCGLCLAIGCPAIAPLDDTVSILDNCIGCGLCADVCNRDALIMHGLNEMAGV